MTRLRIFDEARPEQPLQTLTEAEAIGTALQPIGVRFEQWPTRADITAETSTDAVLQAYQDEIRQLSEAHGYRAADVVSMAPDHPDKATMRTKFLDEHTHAEDEVRFFVDGQGLFTLHADGRVFEVLCERGDLISVPAGTRHWFDMGPNPHFVAVRIFTSPEGWAADFTGDPIARRFPRLEP